MLEGSGKSNLMVSGISNSAKSKQMNIVSKRKDSSTSWDWWIGTFLYTDLSSTGSRLLLLCLCFFRFLSPDRVHSMQLQCVKREKVVLGNVCEWNIVHEWVSTTHPTWFGSPKLPNVSNLQWFLYRMLIGNVATSTSRIIHKHIVLLNLFFGWIWIEQFLS